MELDVINEYTEESLEEWEENDELDNWESAFIRGERSAFDMEDSETVEEET